MVVYFAIISRMTTLLLGILCGYFVPSYDTSVDIQFSMENFTLLHEIVTPFGSWDAVHFVEIAKNGYMYEHAFAFFPLYPICMRYLARLLAVALPNVNEGYVIMLAGILISNVSCVIAAYYLYHLGVLVLRNRNMAKLAAYWFCICPCGIFLSAIYSESLCCLLTFGGMYYLEYHKQFHLTNKTFQMSYQLVLSAVFCGLASCARSNGILLSLFIAYHRLQASPKLQHFRSFLTYWNITGLLGCVAIGPQLFYFAYGISQYCPSLQAASAMLGMNTTTLIVQDRPWCANVIPNVFAMYQFIQKEYWNVGLFNYYTFNQIPNFILAAPMVILSVHGIYVHCRYPSNPSLAYSPYFIMWAFMLINGILVVHIQVITRLLSCCPIIYWTLAQRSMAKRHDNLEWTKYGRIALLYCILYNAVGICLFSTFYPWT